jgi:hypothetical protein
MQRPDGSVAPMLLFDISNLLDGVRAVDLIPDSFWTPQPRFAGQVPVIGFDPERKPQYVTAEAAGFLADADRVIGLGAGADACALPVKIMNTHLVAAAAVGDTSALVSWNPFTQSATAFSRVLDGESVNWNYSGRLYLCDHVYYDPSGSLWDSVAGMAVSGPLAGKTLAPLPVMLTTWKHWRTLHPATLVLSRNTGYPELKSPGLYATDQFARPDSYLASPDIPYTVPHFDPDKTPLPAKSFVLGIAAPEGAVAVPFVALRHAASTLVTVPARKQPVEVRFDTEAQTASLAEGAGAAVSARTTLWFAWEARHPGTAVFGRPAPDSTE